VKKIIYASSSETYGEPQQIPTPETHPILLNIHTDRDSYASSKAICDFYTKLFAKENKIDFLILRIFNTYGPHMDTSEYGQVVPEFIKKMLEDPEFTIIGDGEHTRSFCYVSDHTRLARKLMENVSNEIVNLGNDKETKIVDLARKMHEIENKEFKPKYLPGREYDHKRRQPDITKLKQLINDYPKVSLEQGLQITINDFKNRK
jgi:nucleoside-diphosphate-sugar epimerase